MRTRLARLARLGPGVLACTLAACIAGAGRRTESPEADAVRASFEAYKRAITRSNGAGGVANVSRATLDYFGRMQQLALHASADRVRREGLVNRMWIVTLRHQLPPEDLRTLEPRDLFARAIEAGWLDASIASDALEEVRVDGAVARARRRIGGHRETRETVFVREGGRWRLDLVSDLPEAESELRDLAEEQGISEDELVLALVQASSRVEVPESIWDPPDAGGSAGLGASRR